jgi:predicted nuclease of restriction endonuclease-like (RecB) superfamily
MPTITGTTMIKKKTPTDPQIPEERALSDNATYSAISEVLLQARGKAYVTVNFTMVEAYWHIGRMIVEAQGGNTRAEYGAQFMRELSRRLVRDFGRGFTFSNLNYMRQFCVTFRNFQTVSGNLSWSHYVCLLRVEAEPARQFYMEEATKDRWSVRQLERQINTNFFERLLVSQNKRQCPPKYSAPHRPQLRAIS